MVPGQIVLTLLILFAAFAIIISSVNAQYNYDHVNVTTIVNVTNALPEILNVTVEGANDNITLNAGMTRTVTCNATIRDYNGFNDIDVVNATLYHHLNSSDDADDMNYHYTNTSCAEADNDGQYLANYTCTFDVYYFANNGTWNCNVTVEDMYNFTDSEYNSTNIDSLYALNVTDTIDYGNLSVTEYSDNITATVTNFGNMDINVSVLGYGQTEGDGLGFVCGTGTNISVEHQRFAGTTIDWSSKIPLASTNQDVGITVAQQQDDLTPVTADTYWQLYVPPNPFGVCTGTVRFTAQVP